MISSLSYGQMDSSSDGEGGNAPAAALDKVKRGQRIVFGAVHFGGRSKSAATPPPAHRTLSTSTPRPTLPPAFDDSPEPNRGILARTRSDQVGLHCRDEWAGGIWAQEGLQQSVVALRASVAEYEKEASTQQWKDLLRIHADVQELKQLAATSQSKAPSKDAEESADGLSKFTAVAFEYSKLFDVLMNQAPEYAALAWGAIKFLLVAHINHSKLKHSVHHYLIEFGQQFGVVNQLMTFLPTEKMLEAVAEAYAAFSKFLAKAVKYYRESKLMSVIKAFGFPWETRFQVLVNQIENSFKRIRDLAGAGHYGIAVQSQHLLRTISYDQQEMRQELHQDSMNLRKQLKDELKDEVQHLFDSFDRNWIQRFENIIQASQGQAALPAGSSKPALPAVPVRATTTPQMPPLPPAEQHASRASPPNAAIEYADSIVNGRASKDPTSALGNVTFLADHVHNAKKLRRFRDKSFSLLHRTDHDNARLSVQLKHVTPLDLQQCVGLLKHDAVRDWIGTNHSSLLWVNTQKVYGIADWASSFATRLIEYAGKLEYVTVLYHFCGAHPSSNLVSTATSTIQSMIMQILQFHHKKFQSRKVFPFTMEHFEDAAEDITELWSLLLACIEEADLKCIWVILDNLDNLRKNDDWFFFVSAMQALTGENERIFKIFITARGTSNDITSKAKEMLASTASDNSHTMFVTVPRAISSTVKSLFGKQKRPSRLPDLHEEETHEKANVDDLLGTDSDDEPWEGKEEEKDEIKNLLVASPTSIKVEREGSREDEDSGFSDSSLEFMKDDPLASSAESDWEKDMDEIEKEAMEMNLEDSDSDFLSPTKVREKPVSDLSDLGSSDDDFTKPSSKGTKARERRAQKAIRGTDKTTQKPTTNLFNSSDEEPSKLAMTVKKSVDSKKVKGITGTGSTNIARRQGTWDTSESDEDGF